MKDVGSISHEDFKDIAETKEIDPKDLLDHLKQGWRVLMTFTREMLCNKNEYCAALNAHTYNTVVWSLPIILVGRTDLERLREVETAHKTLQKTHDELVKKGAALQTEFDLRFKELGTLNESLKHAHAAEKTARDKLIEQRDLNRVIEGDIGKIRSALGEIRMKEILGK